MIAVYVYFILGVWTLVSIYTFIMYKSANQYFLQIIPSTFTTIGVLGTFLGIAEGLYEFDVNNIDASIPTLLEGMKNAFYTSIFGICGSILSTFILSVLKKKLEKNLPQKTSSESEAIMKLTDVIRKTHDVQNEYAQKLYHQFLSFTNANTNHLNKIADEITLGQKVQINGTNELKKVLISNQELSKRQMKELIEELSSISKGHLQVYQAIEEAKNENFEKQIQLINGGIDSVSSSIKDGNNQLGVKLDHFGMMLAESNTKVLVEAIEEVIKDFNTQMNELIQRLVKENFEELNNSVQNLNDWQKENKEQVKRLINEFNTVTDNFKDTEQLIGKIVANTKKLTDDNSILNQLIKELKGVLIEDTKFKETTEILHQCINEVKNNILQFDETTNKLNNWIRDEKNIKDSVNTLLSKLQELDKIKSYDSEFWKGTKLKMEEGVSIIKNANNRLAEDLEDINQEFYNRLNTTLQSLDTLIQNYILNSNN